MSRIRRSTSQGTELRSDLLGGPRRSLRQQGVQAEEEGFPYYSPSKTRQPKEEGESSDHDTMQQGEGEIELTAQSEPAKMDASRRNSLQNSHVRRQIILPLVDHSPPAPLTNGTTESLDSLSMDLSLVTTAAEALVEMGTPPKSVQDIVTLPSPSAVDVSIDRGRLLALFERVVVATEGVSCEQMERIHAMLGHIVFRHRMTANRSGLLEASCVITLSVRVFNLSLPFYLCRTWNWLCNKCVCDY